LSALRRADGGDWAAVAQDRRAFDDCADDLRSSFADSGNSAEQLLAGELLRRAEAGMQGKEPGTSAPHPEVGSPSWARVGLKIALMVAAFLLVAVALEAFAGDQVQQVSEKVMDIIGVPGLFIAVFVLDGVPQPFSYAPLLYLAVKGRSMSTPVVFAICAVASYSAALFGYMVGRSIRTFPLGEALFEFLDKYYPEATELMRRRGAVGVGLAAMLPVPLAIATWTAGSFGVPFQHFALAGMGRMPKIAVVLLLSAASSKSAE